MCRALLAVSVAALTLTSGALARATAKLEHGGLDLRLFRPALDGDGFLTVNGARTLRPGHVAASVSLDIGFELLKLDADVNGRVVEVALADSLATALATVSAGVYDGVLVGASFFVQGASGPPASLSEVYGAGTAQDAALRASGPGDVELHAKARLIDARRAGFGLAALARAALPTGQSDEFRGDPGGAITPSLALEAPALGVFQAGAEVGYRWVLGQGAKLPFAAGAVEYGDHLAFGVAASLALSRRIRVVLDSYGSAMVRGLGEKNAWSVEIAGGLKYQINDYLGVQAGGALGPAPGMRGARGRLFSALTIAPSASDFDGDGYSTEDDACPTEPEDFDHFEDSDGCPDPDNDHDGVPDALDDCPDDAEDFDGVNDFDGCPERAIPDSDGDGVDDYPTELREETEPPVRTLGDRE